MVYPAFEQIVFLCESLEKADKIVLKEQILEHVASEPATIDDPTKWQQEQREDRNLPFVADEA